MKKYPNDVRQTKSSRAYHQIIKIIERLQFAKLPSGAVVFEQGDDVNKDFYIIITGSVEVWVKDKSKMQTQTRLRSMQMLPSARTIEPPPKVVHLDVVPEASRQTAAKDVTSLQDLADDNVSHTSVKSHMDVDLDMLKQQDCLINRGELVPELPKQASKLIRKKSDILNNNLTPSYSAGRPQLVKADSFMLYPTPKTEAERKSIRAILLSDSETEKTKKAGMKYLPQTVTEGTINLNSPSTKAKEVKLGVIVSRFYSDER